MLLENKTAVVYGGGGAIGGAVARSFAQEGASVFLAGRTLERLEAVARDIVAEGGTAEVAVVDALDEQAVEEHVVSVVAKAGGIDIALNAVGIMHVQGTRALELQLDDYLHPITSYARTHFVTARAVARPMVEHGSGVILTVSTPGSRGVYPGILGFGTACAAIEATSRLLAAELGPHGVRVVCLRPDGIPEAAAAGSHSHDVFQPIAEEAGITVEAMLAEAAKATPLGRMPTLAEVADTAAFIASDRASAMTGTVVNLTCGSMMD